MPSSVIGRSLTILTSFTEPDAELTLSEVSQRTGIPKPTVHRLVNELAEWRILERTPKGIRLGILLFELGQLAPRQRSVREAALPFLTDLHDSTGLTVHLGLLEQDSVVYVEKLPARNGPQLASRVGGRMPLHCTAIGKALLAFNNPALIRSILTRQLPRYTPYTIIMPGMLQQQLEKIKTTGVAYEHEESTRGVVCVASPLLRYDGEVVAAISVSGWTTRVDITKVGPAVRTAASALSRQLGASREDFLQLPTRSPRHQAGTDSLT